MTTEHSSGVTALHPAMTEADGEPLAAVVYPAGRDVTSVSRVHALAYCYWWRARVSGAAASVA